MELFQAHNQWATRPADERFASLQALYDATFGYFQQKVEKTVNTQGMRAAVDGGEVVLHGPNGNPARFTHYGFGQFCGLMRVSKDLGDGNSLSASIPASFARVCDPNLASLLINYGLLAGEKRDLQMMFHQNGGLLLRSATGEKYSRYWNYNVAKFLLSLPHGWRVPPARPSPTSNPGTIRKATQADVLDAGQFGFSVRVGDDIAPAGIYASDHDLFCYLVNQDASLRASSKENLNRGFFVTNDEVGSGSLRFTCFWYDWTCGNHIVHGAKIFKEIRLRHVGDGLSNKVMAAQREMVKLAQRSAVDDERMIQSARNKMLGQSKEQVIEMVYDKHAWVSKSQAEKSYALAEQYSDIHGDPRSVWGIVSGLTRLSQLTSWQDARDAMDRSAGRILEYAIL